MTAAPSRRKTKPETWGVLVGCVLGALAIPAYHLIHREKDPALRPGLAVSAEQIRAVGGALAKFAGQNGRRPGMLAELVRAGMLRAGDLFDSTRGQTPDIAPTSGRFTENPDVIYFSALRPSDANNLVLLCTLLLHGEGDSYHVVFNDGRYEAMKSRELIRSLNRTYSYISSRAWPALGGGAAPARTSPGE